MSKIRNYKAISVNSVIAKNFTYPDKKVKLSVGIDVAKENHYVCIYVRDTMTDESWTEKPWIVSSFQVQILVDKLVEINKSNPIKIGMESSGTYGDPLRQALTLASLEVVQVRAKNVHDRKEFDGSPSKFDGKDASIIAELVGTGRGEKWDLPLQEERKTRLQCLLKDLKYSKGFLQQHIGHMEAELGRYWPTWPNDKVEFHSQTALKYFAEEGGPPTGPKEEIKQKISRKFSALQTKNIEALVKSAQNPNGVEMNNLSRDFIRKLTQKILETKKEISDMEKDLDELVAQNDLVPKQLVSVLGKSAAGLITLVLGDLSNYKNAASVQKAIGLNLVENSSGHYKGQVHISKRGNSEIRRILYMSSLRLVRNPIIKEWYERKKAGRRGKNGSLTSLPALIAVIRKVMVGLHTAIKKDEPFNPALLFRIKNWKPSFQRAIVQTAKEESVPPKEITEKSVKAAASKKVEKSVRQVLLE